LHVKSTGFSTPPSKDHKPEERSGSDEAGKFKFMWNNREHLLRIKRFVLAVDNDAPGKRLADELIRRLLASRCLMVKYPEGCCAATFYGADIMDDPAFDGDQPLTIVEGEIDKLALETAGKPIVVSVPDGAPPPSPDHKRNETPSGGDQAGKFKFSVPDGAPRRCCCLVSGDRESRPPTWVGQRQRWCCSAAG
jgi:Toprim domain